MRDNLLIQLFLPIIVSGLAADGFTGVIVQQMDQPTQQGIPTNPTVYFQKIYNHRYGWGMTYAKWDTESETEKNYEPQWHETTFQVSTLVIQNPLTPNQYTAADLSNAVATIMQSEATRVTLMAQNVGILRISELTNPYFQDDKDQFEAGPTFDFILTHLQTRVSTIPVVSSFIPGIYRE